MNRNDNDPVVDFWSPEDDEWTADVTDLRHCSASGATPEEAIREALVGCALWLEVAREDGIELPDPLESPFLPEIAREMPTGRAKLAALAATATGAGAEGGAAK